MSGKPHGEGWRLIVDGAGDAAWNMAVDHALLDAVSTSAVPPTLRIYRWERPAVTLGRFQNAARTLKISLETAPRDVPIVRRITGGRGILHGDDLTLSIAAPVSAVGLPASANAIAIYERIAEGLIVAFARLGVLAIMGKCCSSSSQPSASQLSDCSSEESSVKSRMGEETRPNASKLGDCFDIVSRADIVEASTGRKLLGSALHRRDNCFLQQISLPFRSDRVSLLRTSLFQQKCMLDDTPISQLERYFALETLITACQESISASLGVSFFYATLTDEEMEIASQSCQERYVDPNWNWQGKQTFDTKS